MGELLCRSPSVMLGYSREPERTGAVFDGEWLRTGSVVRVDAAGHSFFHDRVEDMIKSGGYNVSSQEVDRVRLTEIAPAARAASRTPDSVHSGPDRS